MALVMRTPTKRTTPLQKQPYKPSQASVHPKRHMQQQTIRWITPTRGFSPCLHTHKLKEVQKKRKPNKLHVDVCVYIYTYFMCTYPESTCTHRTTTSVAVPHASYLASVMSNKNVLWDGTFCPSSICGYRLPSSKN